MFGAIKDRITNQYSQVIEFQGKVKPLISDQILPLQVMISCPMYIRDHDQHRCFQNFKVLRYVVGPNFHPLKIGNLLRIRVVRYLMGVL